MIWVHVPIQNIFKDFWENQTKLLSSENSPDINPFVINQSFKQIMLFRFGEVKKSLNYLWIRNQIILRRSNLVKNDVAHYLYK